MRSAKGFVAIHRNKYALVICRTALAEIELMKICLPCCDRLSQMADLKASLVDPVATSAFTVPVIELLNRLEALTKITTVPDHLN